MRIRRDKDIVHLNSPIQLIYSRKVTPFGTGAKIDFLKEFEGRDVLVVLLKGKWRK